MAASLKRVSTPKKKVKKQFSKRLHSGYDRAPKTDFWSFKDYARTEIDKKETAKVIRDYIKENFSKEDAKIMLEAPEWCFTMNYHVASTIMWKNMGFDFPEEWKYVTFFEKVFADIKKHALAKEKNISSDVSEDDAETLLVPDVKVRSIQDIVSRRASEFISDIEGVLDNYYRGFEFDIENYSPFLELKKIDAPYNVAKAAFDFYTPLLKELDDLLAKKDKALEEGYRRYTLAKRKEYRTLVHTIVSDCEKYMQSKKAIRKTRVSKPLTADKQIKSLKYLKDSSEYKLTSINAVNVIGAQRLYAFNVKSRMLTEFVSNNRSGFVIKGTTLNNLDLEISRETRLRKPEEFLQVVMKQTPTKIAAEWQKLTTKTNNSINGRINSDTLLLRALDK